MTIGLVHPGTSRGTFAMMIGSRKTTPPRMLRIVPLGERHIFLSPNSATRASSGVIVAHLTPAPWRLIALAASIVTWSSVASRCSMPRSSYSSSTSRYGTTNWSLICFQMIRVISSTSSSTTGFSALIFAMSRRSSRCSPLTVRAYCMTTSGVTLHRVGKVEGHRHRRRPSGETQQQRHSWPGGRGPVHRGLLPAFRQLRPARCISHSRDEWQPGVARGPLLVRHDGRLRQRGPPSDHTMAEGHLAGCFAASPGPLRPERRRGPQGRGHPHRDQAAYPPEADEYRGG